MSEDKIIELAKSTLDLEAKAISNLKSFLDNNFVSSVKAIHESKGRVVVTGIGKSANIANKFVSTLNSTGSPAIFMHAAEAIHGDLGIIQKDDIVICISKSGNTDEIRVLVPYIKSMKNIMIAIVGNPDSYLGQNSDFVLNTFVEKEACPNNLAPTTSTSAQLALSDALAVCLLDYRGFSSEDFAKFHPGGTLGRKLFLTIKEVCKENEVPVVGSTADLKSVIMEISSKRLGATAVVENNELMGIITDGDLRRMLQNSGYDEKLVAQDIMHAQPKKIEAERLATEGLKMMEENNISQLVVVEGEKYLGIIHIHDLLKQNII
ncbi:MAG: KpsF/GutQ family sugar-phosphate isomerase [Flavobacteriales bacterium]|nr:KpsF/GutQ family sugar-phosphate isomerase [Flavobacteriales bacterium]